MASWWLLIFPLLVVVVIFPFYLRWSVNRNRKKAIKLTKKARVGFTTTAIGRAAEKDEQLVMWMAGTRFVSWLDPMWQRMDGFMDFIESLPFIPKDSRRS
jgi:hypothetical protein